ncbi:MAG: NAD-dependent epimerase/dehydratase family protein [Methylococcaceae bacterium]
MKILVTGTAGLISSYVVQCLLERGDEVAGPNNINDYYDINLKLGRLAKSGIIAEQLTWYKFVQMNLKDKQAMQMCVILKKNHFNIKSRTLKNTGTSL